MKIELTELQEQGILEELLRQPKSVAKFLAEDSQWVIDNVIPDFIKELETRQLLELQRLIKNALIIE